VSCRGRTWYTAKSSGEPCAGDQAGDIRMGKPTPSDVGVLREEREPGELKHLSSPRKREDSASSGERKRKRPNHPAGWGCRVLQEALKAKWKAVGNATREGESPVDAAAGAGRKPEYRRTREIRREAGQTTAQGRIHDTTDSATVP
jgi:hypothetical protein